MQRVVISPFTDSIFENNNVPVLKCLRHSLRLTAANHPAIEFYGFSREEFTSMTLADLHPDEEKNEIIRLIRNVDTEEIVLNNWHHKHKNGETSDIKLLTGTSNCNDYDELTFMIVDVTPKPGRIENHDVNGPDRQRVGDGYTNISQDTIIQDPEPSFILSAFFDSFPDLLFRLGRNGTCLNLFTGDKNLLFAPKKEIIGKKISDLLPEDIGIKLHQTLENAFITGEITTINYDLDLPKGKFHFECRIKVISDDQAIAIIRDISDRCQNQDTQKREKALLSSLLDSAPDYIFAKDTHGRYTMGNREYCRFLEIEADTLIGKTDFDLFEREQAEKFTAEDRNVMKTGVPEVVEDIYRYDSGTTIHFETMKAPWFSEDGKLLGILGIARNATKYKNLEQKLKEKEQLILDLFTSMDEVFWIMSYPGLTMLNISPSAEQLYGYSAPSFLDNPGLFLEVIHPDDRYILRGALNAISETGKTESVYRILLPDGSTKWINNKTWLHFSEDNTPAWIGGIAYDITRIKNLEDELSYRLSMQNVLLDLANNFINVPVSQVDQAMNRSLEQIGSFVKADRAYIFKYNFENYTTSNTHEWCAEGIEPEIQNQQDTPLDFIPEWINAHRNHRAMIIPDIPSLPDGTGIKDILEPQGIKSIITIPMYNQFNLVGFLGFDSVREYRVYTNEEQKLLKFLAEIVVNAQNRVKFENKLLQSEERFRQLSENVDALIWLMDVQSERVIYCNPACLSFLGISESGDESFRNNMLTRVFGDDRASLEACMSKKSHHNPCMSTIRIYNSKNQLFWFNIRIQPVVNSGGNVWRKVFIANDITVLKDAEESLKKALDMEKQLGVLKSRFVTIASHEFRTPLASILMACETLENYMHRLNESDTRKYLDRISKNVIFLRNIIEKVLNLSRIESGKIPVMKESIGLNEFLDSWLFSYTHKYPKTHNIICERIPEQVFLFADNQLIIQVLDNLVSNSRKYSPEGTAITISAKTDKGKVIITVADKGIGIPDNEKSMIFESFHRAANAKDYEGTGLGLALVKQIIHRHDGQIWVESVLNEGATFFMELPVHQIK
jgi:PAS domain S-box-containing protein